MLIDSHAHLDDPQFDRKFQFFRMRFITAREYPEACFGDESAITQGVACANNSSRNKIPRQLAAGYFITGILFFIIILSAITICLIYLFNTDINSDEAVIGLMGRHILNGEFPIYYYGQNYMGALEAYLSAIVFFIFGSSPLILKMAPFFCYMLFVITTFFLVRKLADEKTAILAMLFTAIPPYFLAAWGMQNAGGYIETLLFGNIIFILTLRLISSKDKQNVTLILLGIVCGISWWVNQLVCYYILPAFICFLIYPNGKRVLFEEKMILSKKKLEPQKYHFTKIMIPFGKLLNFLVLFGIIAVFLNLNWGRFGINTGFLSFYLYKRDSIKLLIGAYLLYLFFFGNRALYAPKGIMLFLVAFTIGNMPTVVYGLNHKLFTGTNITNIESFAAYFINYWRIGIPVILGISKPWSLTAIFNLTIRVLVYISYLFFIFYFLFKFLKCIVRYRTYPPVRYTLTIIMFALIPIIFSFSKFGHFIKEPRYILPVYTVLTICYSVTVVELFKIKLFKILTIFFAVFIILANAGSNYFNYETKQLEIGNIPKGDKKVIDFLLAKGIYYAYADYWVAYKITFESKERIICASLGQSRYPKYEQLVLKQNNPAYIMRDEENEVFENYLNINKISYKVKHIMGYWIYYSIDILPSQKNKNNRTEQGIKIRPAEWGAYTNTSKNNVEHAFDGNLFTRWTANIPQNPGMFFTIDLKKVYKITRVELTSQNSIYDYPRGCRIEISLDGEHWQMVKDVPKVGLEQFVYPPLIHPFKMYHGWQGFTFDPIDAKYVKITQTGSDEDHWWSINEVSIYEISFL